MTARRDRRWRSQSGQTFVEYTMIVGLLTAIIIAVTRIIVPPLAYGIVRLVYHMAEYMTSPPV